MKKTTRVLKLWSKHNLPEELWPEILSRLPVKSLLRFRCVSRSWKLMIDDPNFACLHLNRFNNGDESRLFFVTGSSYECVVKNSKTLRTNCSLGFLASDLESVHVLRTSPARYGTYNWWSILSSIDGLFILKSGLARVGLDFRLMLWNPSIKKTLILPPSKISPNSTCVDFGLGFDPSINDYKCVRFVSISPKSGFQITAIYTLGTNSWKEIEFQGDERQKSQDITFLYVKRIVVPFEGALFALAQDQYPIPVKLVSFDLRREVFGSTDLPVVDGPDAHSRVFDQALTVVDDGSSLGVVNLTRPEGSIWILERLGDDAKSWSWTQRYTFVTVPQFTCSVWFLKFLFLKKNRELLLRCVNSVICHNLETGQEKMMLEKNRKTLHEHTVFRYIESLLLLHH